MRERAIGDGPLILSVRRLAVDGLKAWQEVLERGYEGRRLALRRRALDELAQGEVTRDRLGLSGPPRKETEFKVGRRAA